MRAKSVVFVVLAVVAAGCPLMKMTPAPGIVRGTTADSRFIVRYRTNALSYSMPSSDKISCPHAFFTITIDLINASQENQKVVLDDFALKLSDGETLKPLGRSEFCRLYRDLDCERGVGELKKILEEDKLAAEEIVLFNSTLVAECNHDKLYKMIDQEWELKPGKGVVLELAFTHDKFSEDYLAQQRVFFSFRDLPPFILAGGRAGYER